MDTQTGLATYNGVSGDFVYTGEATAAPIDTDADQTVTGLSVTDEADVTEKEDGNSKIKGYNVKRKRKRVRVEFYPTATAVGGNNTVAEALKAVEMPAIPGKVTLSGFPGGAANGSGLSTDGVNVNGDWIYLGGGEVQYSEDMVKVVMTLVQPRNLAAGVTITNLCTAI
jgi:hypothetical protein